MTRLCLTPALIAECAGDPQDLLAQFRPLREANLRMFARITPDDCRRPHILIPLGLQVKVLVRSATPTSYFGVRRVVHSSVVAPLQ